MTQSYPLHWPTGWKRTEIGQRKSANFGKKTQSSHGNWQVKANLSIADATKRLLGELERLGAKRGSIIISSNLQLRNDGLPRSDQREPQDGGIAVYFVLGEKERVLACDKWNRVADNIAAIAAHIDAIRRQDRYGVGTLDQAFAGYAALPAPGSTSRPWYEILGVFATSPLSECEAAYRQRAKEAHPDNAGGSNDKMAELNAAIQTARKLKAA